MKPTNIYWRDENMDTTSTRGPTDAEITESINRTIDVILELSAKNDIYVNLVGDYEDSPIVPITSNGIIQFETNLPSGIPILISIPGDVTERIVANGPSAVTAYMERLVHDIYASLCG